MVPKTNGEIYVSTRIDKYIITLHLFSVLCQRRYLVKNIECEVAT